jgi:hypothetical protein
MTYNMLLLYSAPMIAPRAGAVYQRAPIGRQAAKDDDEDDFRDTDVNSLLV